MTLKSSKLSGQISYRSIRSNLVGGTDSIYHGKEIRSDINWEMAHFLFKNNKISLSASQISSFLYPYEKSYFDKNQKYLSDIVEQLSFSDTFRISPDLIVHVGSKVSILNNPSTVLQSHNATLSWKPGSFGFRLLGGYTEALKPLEERHLLFTSTDGRSISGIDTPVRSNHMHAAFGLDFFGTFLKTSSTITYYSERDVSIPTPVECEDGEKSCFELPSGHGGKHLALDNTFSLEGSFFKLRGSAGLIILLEADEPDTELSNVFEREKYASAHPLFRTGLNGLFNLGDHVDITLSVRGKTDQSYDDAFSGERYTIPGYLTGGTSLSIHSKERNASVTFFADNAVCFQNGAFRNYIVNRAINEKEIENDFGRRFRLPALFGLTLSVSY